MFARILMLALLAFSSVVAFSQSQTVTWGVLEDLPGHYWGDPNFRAVRMVFEKDGSSWQVAESTKSVGKMTWAVGFDSKVLGQVTSGARESEYFSEAGLQDVVGEMSIPTVGKRSADYGGFVGAAVYRPPDRELAAVLQRSRQMEAHTTLDSPHLSLAHPVPK